MKPQVWLRDAFNCLGIKHPKGSKHTPKAQNVHQSLKTYTSSRQAAQACGDTWCGLQLWAGEKQMRKSVPEGLPPREQREQNPSLMPLLQELPPLLEVFTVPVSGPPVRARDQTDEWEFLLWPSYPCSTTTHWACLEVLSQGWFYIPGDTRRPFLESQLVGRGATTGIDG